MQFTIITPTLDSAAQVEGAIRSVREQTWQDHEHLVIDGGSRDLTLEIVGRYPEVTCLSEPDRGIYDAINKGVARARGDWLMVLGADDRLAAPEVLQNVAASIQPSDDVLYGDVRLASSGRRFDGPFDARKLYHHNICQQAIFYRRRLFGRIGSFSLEYPLLADWEYNLRWFFNPALQHRYLDLVVADFCDTGSSGTTFDASFYRVRRRLFLEQAYRSAPPGFVFAKLAREAMANVLGANLADLRETLSMTGHCLRRTLGLASSLPDSGSNGRS